MLSEKQSGKSSEMKQLIGACDFEQLMLSPCSFHPLKGRNNVQSNAGTHKNCSSTSWSIEFERYTSKPMNKLCCHNNFWNAMNAQHPFDEKLDLANESNDWVGRNFCAPIFEAICRFTKVETMFLTWKRK
jgi:hypothetical protein